MPGDPWDQDEIVKPAAGGQAAVQAIPLEGQVPDGYEGPLRNAAGDVVGYALNITGKTDADTPQAQQAPTVAPWDQDEVVKPAPSAGYTKAKADLVASEDTTNEGVSNAILNGLTFNNADRVKGGLAATGAAAKWLMGDHSVSPADAYGAERDLARAAQAKFEAEHPVSNLALNLVGGAPLGEGAGALIGRGASTLETVGNGIGVGAAMGAGYGAGADKDNPLRGAAAGAGEGAALGVAAPVVAAGGRALFNAGRGAVSGARDLVSNASTGALTARQEAAASADAARFLQGRMQAGRVTPADISASPLAARGATVAEAMGPSAVSDAAALIRRPGDAAQMSIDTLRPRAEGRTSRLLDDVAHITGVAPASAERAVETAVEQGRVAAKPLYDAALASPEPVVNDDLRALAQRPAIKAAAKAAYTRMLNDGENPEAYGIVRNTHSASSPGESPLSLPADGARLSAPPGTDLVARPGSGLASPRQGGQVGPQIDAEPLRPIPDPIPIDEEIHLRAPTAKTWDYIKKTAANMVERDPVSGGVIRTGKVGVQNGGLETASRDLTAALAGTTDRPGAIPGYRAALDRAGDYLKVQDAYERSQGMLFGTGRGKTVNDFSDLWSAATTPGEQSAVRSRLAADIMEKADAGTLTPGALRKDGVYRKLTTAFGREQADRLVQAAAHEQQLSATGGRMMAGTGSITSEVLNHGAEGDAMMDTLKSGMHVAHRLAEGRPISAAMAAISHAAGNASAASRVPLARASRDALARLYLSDASGFAGSFTPPRAPAAAAYLARPHPVLSQVLPTATAQMQQDRGP